MPDPATAVLVALLALAWLGSLVVVARAVRRRAVPAPDPATTPAGPSAADDDLDGRDRLLDVLRAGAVLVDADDRVVLANRTAQDLGATLDDRLARPLLRTVARARQVRSGQVGPGQVGPGEGVEDDVALPRGRWRSDVVSLRVRAVPFPDGAVALLVEDRTEDRRLEAVRHDFVANVGHELKTPVGAMRLLAEAIGDSADDEATVRRFAARAEREAERLGRLVGEIVDLSRLQGGEPIADPRPVDLDAVVSEAVDRVATAATARRIRVAVAGERGVVVPGDAAHLTTALANLVDNAVTYSPDDTDVTVAVRSRGGRVEVAVSDQGVGIAETDRPRVFERFFRGDRSRLRPDGTTGGNGLGLAIVKHVAENHGGSVDVWSVEGSGSTFTLALPAGAPAARTAPPLETHGEGPVEGPTESPTVERPLESR